MKEFVCLNEKGTLEIWFECEDGWIFEFGCVGMAMITSLGELLSHPQYIHFVPIPLKTGPEENGREILGEL